MRILITNCHLAELGGSETFTYTIAKELAKKHEVLIWTPRWGKLLRDKFSVFAQTCDTIPKNFDIAHIHHRTCAEQLQNIKKPKVMLIHSPSMVYEESPVAGMQKYLAVSEETQTFLKQQGYDSEIVRNPIDTERFKPIIPVNKQIKTVLVLSNHFRYLEMVKDAVISWGKKLILFGSIAGNGYKWEVEEWINRADLVFTVGRGCYESMSCGREVVIVGNFGLDGIASRKYIFAREYNCSGRWGKEIPTKETMERLIGMIEYYSKNSTYSNRDLILKYHDVKNIAKQLEKIYNKEVENYARDY